MERIPDRIAHLVLDWEGTGELIEAARSASALAASPALVPLLCAVLYRALGGPMVVAVSSRASELAGDISLFLPGEAMHMPGPGPGGEWFRPHDEAEGMRLKAARALAEGGMVVVGVGALLAGLPAPLPEPWPLRFEQGDELEPVSLLENLVAGGYAREYTVEGWSQFAMRGGILDVFPSTSDRPVRIELEGDRVASLREFNVVTQRSGERITNCEVFPVAEPAGTGAGNSPPGTRVLAVDPDLIRSRALEQGVETGMEADAPRLLERWGETVEVMTSGSPPRAVGLAGASALQFSGDLDSAVEAWRRLGADGTTVYLLLDGPGQVERARELWIERGGGSREPLMGVGRLGTGFTLEALKIAVFSSSDLLGRRAAPRRPARRSAGTPVASYAEIEVDGYVVHVDQGVGVYRGLVSREVLGVTREYLLLEYAAGDRLYVPTGQLAKVQRYIGSENPTVHRLRSKEWTRARRGARRSAERTARELLGLYLERKSAPGYPFSADQPWQRELEQSFPYEDTPDQARATEEVKRDMESERVMDRLICGDVGYGKTEIAVRASMKAALDSKQVAVLVPTTVLARQHFETFRERMAPFPVRVEMLSRFLSRADQERVVASLARGETDLVIGTHRLLQEDVSFRDLGLLVVDEEQRFGVTHKERLRRLKRSVDTLSLSATPIPRTLQMSLSGVRDISIIDTPPEDRHPIATYVGEFDMELVGRALTYELDRGGQAFYVHNRIQSINRVAQMLRERFASESIAVAHGRMDEDQLERVMLEFADGMHGVLVCTTIIESGLDLPNVNTLVVDRADRLGLAQLYQIRGRVGRATRRAFAYLFYPSRGVLTDTAVARLATISDMTALGSGMRVAMRDLEIRGAGNLLGAEQSGQIEAVGFELYCELLREAVDILKGEAPVAERESVLELPIDAYIPDEYVSDEETRVEEYRRLIVAGRVRRLDELERELEDRFGEPPPEVRRMLELERLRVDAADAGLESVILAGGELRLKCFPGRENSLALAARSAREREISASAGIYIDEVSRTLYLKLSLEEVKKRQELLLKWLKLIIDDIMQSGHAE
ncbi:MAG: transcription-repair coupling factor [Actinomycetota bacterium]